MGEGQAQLDSEFLTSENKKGGMKYLTQAVHALLKKHRECTYQFICKSISTHNSETASRRIYDILNVMRAVKLVGKRNKIYYLVDDSGDLKRLKSEKNRLIEMKETFEFITARNALMADGQSEKLYLPFMIISADKESEIHCDTNEERSFFNFESNRPLKVVEDLGILKEIREQSREQSKENSCNMVFDPFMF